MKAPPDAQAGLLAVVQEHANSGETVEWLKNAADTWAWTGYRTSMAVLYVEQIDRERNTGCLVPLDQGRRSRRLTTLNSCTRYGWLADAGERMHIARRRVYSPDRQEHIEQSDTWWLHALELTEDGLIALGVWRERKLKAPPAPSPTLSDREREIAELAARAIELGYCLSPREPARKEARRLRREGWFGGCWIANSAYGLVPTALTLCEIRPDAADEISEQEATAEGVFV